MSNWLWGIIVSSLVFFQVWGYHHYEQHFMWQKIRNLEFTDHIPMKVNACNNLIFAIEDCCLCPDDEGSMTSETLLESYQTTQCKDPEDSNLQTHLCKNLKSYFIFVIIHEIKDYCFSLQSHTSIEDAKSTILYSSATWNKMR